MCCVIPGLTGNRLLVKMSRIWVLLKMNIRKFAIAFAACAAISAYAQDDEVTSFEDFDEPVAESNATNNEISEVNAAGGSATNGDARRRGLRWLRRGVRWGRP